MRDLRQILDAHESLLRDNASAALATVVAVEGSSYRRPGARMLIALDGRSWGGVSGGCLERDVARRARGVIDSGIAIVSRYQTDSETGGDDPLDANAWTHVDPAASLGCGGAIEILIERVAPAEHHVMNVLSDVLRHRRCATLVTVSRVGGSVDARAGDRIATIRDPALAAAVRNDLAIAATGKATVEARRHVFAHGWADVLVEPLRPPLALTIYGDGTDVEPIIAMSNLLGWHVLPVGLRSHPIDAPIALPADIESAAVVMSHNLRRDAAVLTALLASPAPRYIGVLGPRHRTERLLASIDRALVERARDRLFYPVGLDLGAETPEQVALAITSEIQAFFNGRTGGQLRASAHSIHGPMRSDRNAYERST